MVKINYLNVGDYLAKPDETIKEHTENLLCEMHKLISNNYLVNEKEIELLEKSIEIHDIGKSNSCFQDRVVNGGNFNPKKEVPHNVLSYYISDTAEDDFIIDYAVINHHHYVDNFESRSNEDISDLIERDLIDLQLKLTSSKINERKIEEKIEEKIDNLEEILEKVNLSLEKGDLTHVKILGLLNKCDYSASAHMPIEYPANFLEEKLEAMMNKWSKSNNFSWNELQKFCIEKREENIIAIASTGMGKTEGALLWIGDSKGFFILPLKTAINSIYKRVVDSVIEGENISERVALLHGDSMNIYQGMDKDKNIPNITSYYNESKRFSIPLNISTPDQLFDFIFKSRGYELKYAMMSYSKVVIDEIQAYGPDLLASMVLGIQKIIDIGGKVSIFTATFPPFIMDLIMKTNKNGKIIEKYRFKEAKFVTKVDRHNIKVIEKELNSEDIINHYEENNTESKKYLIVCNTVKNAQKIYEDLVDAGFENINILHSKFIKKDRSKKEDKIMDTGKTFIEDGDFNNKDEIWISTQIVEASLDIDFDYLFTELSDLNSFFQRLGRVNRKGKKSINRINSFIYTEINNKLLINRDKETGFIDEGLYKLSKEALLEFKEGVISERKKQEMIEEYFTTEKLSTKESRFLEEYWKIYKYYNNLNEFELADKVVNRKFRNIISFDVFPVDLDEGLINGEEINQIIYQIEENNKKIHLSENKEERKALILDGYKLKDALMQYTVSVGIYDINRGDLNSSETIEISKNRFIRKVKCRYKDMGFQRLTKDDYSDNRKEKDEIYDNFI
ncbi:MAG: CRISPR-associated helicase Cas3' [Peptostreptococcus sp.]|uniref:CRISPR-associated helicase Cas3' n=1 Tax=Peptostreptococcus sp. TaxID=1262 RepID=UPI002FC8FC32